MALVLITIVGAVVGVIVAVTRLDGDDAKPVEASVLIDDAAFPVALTPTGEGGFLYAEKETGAVRRVDAAGVLAVDPVAVFDVNPEGQRGLLGIVEIEGEVFVSLVRASDDHLVVLRAADQTEVWVGPPSTGLANGGHLVALADGRILIGVGDLQDRPARDRGDTVNGKLLVLDPGGPPDQQPEVRSTGWNNPFAVTVDAGGTIWVADNSPGDEPERLGRGDRPAGDAVDLDGLRAPSALVDLGDGRLGLCGFGSGTLDAVDTTGDHPIAGSALVAPCRTSAAVLADGRIITATETQIFVVAPLDP